MWVTFFKENKMEKKKYRLTEGIDPKGWFLNEDGTLAPHTDKSIEAFLGLGWIEETNVKQEFTVQVVFTERYITTIKANSRDEALVMMERMEVGVGETEQERWDNSVQSPSLPILDYRDENSKFNLRQQGEDLEFKLL
jgi:hypothetical protein